MRTSLPLILIVALAVPASAGGSRRPVTTASAALRDEITISFVGVVGGGSDAIVDAGTMSQSRSKRGRGRRTTALTQKTFGIRLDAVSGATGGTATLRASVETEDGRVTLRIDGVEIGTIPRVVDAQARIGEVTTHTLEIEVPASAPEGTFASAVRWEITRNGS